MPHRRTIIGPSFQLLSNWCSMGCASCGIHVAAPSGPDIVTLEEQHLVNARKTLSLVKDTLDSMGIAYGMVEQSGGEPTHHPQIVEAVGEVFETSVHKIISNGLTSKSIYDYLKRRQEQAFIVLSIDNHKIDFNRIRLGAMHKSQPDRAMEIHDAILRNLDLFTKNNIQVVVSSIISRWNIAQYLDFIEWLEQRYPNQIQDGMLVPIPVSLVSFGNPNVGKLNPSAEQVSVFEEAIYASNLLTVKRTREWLLKQLVGHYRNKQRFFEMGESLDQISLHPSKYSCEILRYMISFNYQDEEILRPPSEALFQGYLCGVKVLANIGYTQESQLNHRSPLFSNRPSNMQADKKYYRTDQIREYINKRDSLIDDKEAIEVGSTIGYFSDIRRGMCMLDDFDGVWWPFNVYIQGIVEGDTLGEYWSLFRNHSFMTVLQRIKKQVCSVHHASISYS